MFFDEDGRADWSGIAKILKKADDSLLSAADETTARERAELINSFLQKYLDLAVKARDPVRRGAPDTRCVLNVDGQTGIINFYRIEAERDGASIWRYVQEGSLPLLPDKIYKVEVECSGAGRVVLSAGDGSVMAEKLAFAPDKRANSTVFATGSGESWFTVAVETPEVCDNFLKKIRFTTIPDLKSAGAPSPTRGENLLTTGIQSLQTSLRERPDISSWPLAERVALAAKSGEFKNFLKNLRVAAIMDEFTFRSYEPEANLLQLTPGDWEKELKNFKPDLLFVESAWKGKDGLWENKINSSSEPLLKILAWHKKNKIPTVFWNKEDPVHFDYFLPVANLFDAIFTHDEDCVERYKETTGNDRVYHLHFGVQPRKFNPIENCERRDGFFFAGSYYAKYPERCRNLKNFTDAINKVKFIDIYDRQMGQGNERLTYPGYFEPYLRPGVPYSEIEKIYKGYKYALNLNSFKQSQSQCARRIYELLACNTATASNFSRGARLIFGDAIFNSDDGEELAAWIKKLDEDPRLYDQIRLLGLRKVMSGCLYQDRLATMVGALVGVSTPDFAPEVVCVARTTSEAESESVIRSFKNQSWRKKRLFIIGPGASEEEGIKFASEQETADLIAGADDETWFAFFDPADWRGASYLTDLLLATRYADFKMAGKGKYFALIDGEPKIVGDGAPYAFVDELSVASAIMRPKLFAKIFAEPAEKVNGENDLLSLDYFNYCRGGANAPDAVLEAECGDPINFDRGAAHFVDIEGSGDEGSDDSPRALSGERLLTEFDSDNPFLKLERNENGDVYLISELGEEETGFLRGKTFFPVADLKTIDDFLSVYLSADGGARLSVRYELYDKNLRQLKSGGTRPRKNDRIPIRSDAAFIKINIGATGSGKSKFSSIIFSDKGVNIPRAIRAARGNLIIADPDDRDIVALAGVARLTPADAEIFILDPEAGVVFGKTGPYDSITGNKKVLKKLLKDPLITKIYYTPSVKAVSALKTSGSVKRDAERLPDASGDL